jgi:hypothetical protein
VRVVVHLQTHDDAQVRFHRAAGADDVLAGGERDDSADWTIDAAPGEFWWPRAESLKDVLAPIPPRYTIVQALARDFVDERRRLTVNAMKADGRTLLRPVHRAGYESRPVPLRAWYPLEVLRLDTSHAGGELVEDPRFQLALAGNLSFRTPDIVDDAAYAVDCADVGEVDLPRLEAYVSELEQRVAFLEQRLWPRLMRAASTVVRRR